MAAPELAELAAQALAAPERVAQALAAPERVAQALEVAGPAEARERSTWLPEPVPEQERVRVRVQVQVEAAACSPLWPAALPRRWQELWVHWPPSRGSPHRCSPMACRC